MKKGLPGSIYAHRKMRSIHSGQGCPNINCGLLKGCGRIQVELFKGVEVQYASSIIQNVVFQSLVKRERP